MTENMMSEKLQEEEEINSNEQTEKQPIEPSNKHELTGEIQVIKAVKESENIKREDETNKKIIIFLRGKGLSENFIKALTNTDLTGGYIRNLKALDLNDNDIEHLQELWQTKIKNSKSNDSINSNTSDNSSSDASLSQDSLYLKEVLSKPLIEALREIIAKKPIDPIEYLGHWLLHFKLCEEQAMRQKEQDLQLLINKEKLRIKEIEDKELCITEKRKTEKYNKY